eukprot:jgi/Chlat1/1795/Chrsp135S02121
MAVGDPPPPSKSSSMKSLGAGGGGGGGGGGGASLSSSGNRSSRTSGDRDSKREGAGGAGANSSAASRDRLGAGTGAGATNGNGTSSSRPSSAANSSGPSSPTSLPPKPSTPASADRTPSGRRPRGTVTRSSSQTDLSGRVRVAVRCRPMNEDEKRADADARYLSLLPETNQAVVQKNHWESDKYFFDAVFPEYTSQTRIYDTVAKPVVESVLRGYNGTVMAYGQTGTGKTFTLGHLGRDDVSLRGIMPRAVEDIIEMCDRPGDKITMSYIQLYMEKVQDLLASSQEELAIQEDSKTGEVSIPGAIVKEVRKLDEFAELLELGEKNRVVANQKMNTNSSRSHAVLMINVSRSAHAPDQTIVLRRALRVTQSHITTCRPPDPSELSGGTSKAELLQSSVMKKGKLLIVDLAGSERVNKTGSEGVMFDEAKFINLSLTSLGKCINALSSDQPGHIPYRDSKLTRILKDSFGGTARTSMIVTVGPAASNRSETMSTILFGQRALKIENTLKQREEVDYKGLSTRLREEMERMAAMAERADGEANKLESQLQAAQEAVAQYERQRQLDREALEREKAAEVEKLKEGLETKAEQLARELAEAKAALQRQQAANAAALAAEQARVQATMKEMEQEIVTSRAESASQADAKAEQNAAVAAVSAEQAAELEREIRETRAQMIAVQLEHQRTLQQTRLEFQRRLETTEGELIKAKSYIEQGAAAQPTSVQKKKKFWSLSRKKHHHSSSDASDTDSVPGTPSSQLSFSSQSYIHPSQAQVHPAKTESWNGTDQATPDFRRLPDHEYVRNQKAAIAKLFDHVGLPTIFGLFELDDIDVRLHAAKVVANLAAEEGNQEKIVKEGGLKYVLKLLTVNENDNVCRVAAGAIANLAMNEHNQVRIIEEGGLKQLVVLAKQTGDPQTQRMVAGAIANLCGNASIQDGLRSQGGIKALIQLASTDRVEVLAQVARGFANFAKCDKAGHSKIIEEGGLPWIIAMAQSDMPSVKKHAELALCHVAHREENAKDVLASGALKLLRKVAEGDSTDIGQLAKKTITGCKLYENAQGVI